MCVLSGPHVFDLNVGPLSSQNKKCFSLWFLPQQPWCDSQQQHVEKKKGKKTTKKRSCELANILPACRSGNIWERNGGRKEDTVSRQEALHSKPCTLTSNKPHISLRRGVLHQAQRWAVYLCFSEWKRKPEPVFRYAVACFNTLDYYARHEKLIRDVASCILFKMYHTPPKLSTRCLIHIHSPVCKFHCF